MSRCLRWGLLCLLVSLVLGLGGHGVRAGQQHFETDYILCPAHLRVQGPQGLRVSRGPQARELRVSWTVPPHLTAGIGSPLDQAALTVIADDGASPVVQQRPPTDTAAVLYPVPRGRDLEVAVAWTRQGHVISEIRRVRLRSTQLRTWEREGQEPSRPAVAAEPELPSLPPVEGGAVKAGRDTRSTDEPTPPAEQQAELPRLPPVEMSVKKDEITDTSITVQWEVPAKVPAEALDKFRLRRCSGTGSDCSTPKEMTKDTTQAELDGLRPHTKYQPQIRAVAGTGSGYQDSGWSSTTATTMLAKVTGLSASPPTSSADTGMKLTWKRPADTTNITNFAIQYCTESACGTPMDGGTAAAGVTEHTVTGLTRYKDYWFRIRAKAAEAAQHSAWSDVVPGKTAKTKVAKVTNFHILAKHSRSVILLWTRPSDTTNIAKYEIRQCETETETTCITVSTKIAFENGFIVRGLQPGTDYTFRIRSKAKDASYEDSDWSDTAKIRLANVTNFRILATHSRSVILLWTLPSDTTNIAKYEIRQCETETETTCITVSTKIASENGFIVRDLQPGTDYTFSIRSKAKDTSYEDSDWFSLQVTTLVE